MEISTMNDSTNSEHNSVESEKPVVEVQNMDEEVKFPPFPDPTDDDFEEDASQEERDHYKNKYKDLNTIVTAKLHCSACDRHLGCSGKSILRMRIHPMLRTLMCQPCHTFYNSGEFEKGDDGSELYCRWCGQGGQVYCCSNCPHVFCAKCIKRNFGIAKIKEIEATDDWKCFKCNPKCLWDLRAVCWAAFRYCDFRNKFTHETQDPKLKEAFQKACDRDLTECCRNKGRRKEKSDEKKQKQKEEQKKPLHIPVKPQSTIQVKKFASINIEDQANKNDKKNTCKRPASPKNKPMFIRNPMAATTKLLTTLIMPPMAKKIRMSGPTMVPPVRFNNDRKSINAYTRIRPKQVSTPIMYNGFRGNDVFNNMVVNDNINLSLESLTQGLDMATVAGVQQNNIQNDAVVCTPDFPLEPLCEVVEDNNDDDVQCIGPVVTTKNPPPLVSRNVNVAATDNIIQMTENDVSVNADTGGLKFRVDPQTLSSNKMYRLPDGRVFAINANPNMPGGYSATIVAVTDDSVKLPAKGATYAAKLSSIGAVGSPMLTPPLLKTCHSQDKSRSLRPKRSNPKSTNKVNKSTDVSTRDMDLKIPVEWYRYNLIDAVDALEYSLSRLKKLKNETTTSYLRTRSVSEMRSLHRRLDRLLSTSTNRFNEIRENFNKEFKQYLTKKLNGSNTSEDDDDVEILHDDNDAPIFIDENSLDSNANESHDVDLTVLGSSDINNSSEKSPDKNESYQEILKSLISEKSQDEQTNEESILPDSPAAPDDNRTLSTEAVNSEKQQNSELIDLNPKTSEDEPAVEEGAVIVIKDKKNCVNGDDNLTHTKHDAIEDKVHTHTKHDTIEDKVNDGNIKDNKDSQEVIEEKHHAHSDKNDSDPSFSNKNLNEPPPANKDTDELLSEEKDGQELSDEMIEELLYDDSND